MHAHVRLINLPYGLASSVLSVVVQAATGRDWIYPP